MSKASEINKERYKTDLKYKEKILKKGNLRNKAISILIKKHKKEFDRILNKTTIKVPTR